jgi:hypothetical protein
MLAELEGRASPTENADVVSGADDATAMLADLDRRTSQLGGGAQEDDDEDLETLHGRLTGTLSPQLFIPSPPVHTGVDRPEAVLNPAIAPYVIAIQLEVAGCEWEKAQGWTTLLFSSGLDGYRARREKDRIVKQAEEELAVIIQHTLQEEELYLSLGNNTRLPHRLIVSNIAADAGEEDLKEFFYGHRFVV